MKGKFIVPVLLVSLLLPGSLHGSTTQMVDVSEITVAENKPKPKETAAERKTVDIDISKPVFPVNGIYKIINYYGFSSSYVDFTELKTEDDAVLSIFSGVVTAVDDNSITVSSYNIDITYSDVTAALKQDDVVEAGEFIGANDGSLKISGKRQDVPFDVLGTFFPETSIMSALAEEDKINKEAIRQKRLALEKQKKEQEEQKKRQEAAEEAVKEAARNQETAPVFLSASGTAQVSSYDDLFQKAGEKYDVDPKLIKAVAYHESRFNPNAVSRKGAMGIMQLMPGTAEMLGVNDPFDPEQNIDGGTRYLKGLLDAYDGNLELTLAGYNAGPYNVKKYQGVPPYRETQDFIKAVLITYKEMGGNTDA